MPGFDWAIPYRESEISIAVKERIKEIRFATLA